MLDKEVLLILDDILQNITKVDTHKDQCVFFDQVTSIIHKSYEKQKLPSKLDFDTMYRIILFQKTHRQDHKALTHLVRSLGALDELANYMNFKQGKNVKNVVKLDKAMRIHLSDKLTRMKANVLLSLNKGKADSATLATFDQLLFTIDLAKERLETSSRSKIYALHKDMLNLVNALYKPAKAQGDLPKLRKAKDHFNSYIRLIYSEDLFNVETTKG